MQFDELGLNRLGFKSEPDPVTAGATTMSSNNNNPTPKNTLLGEKSGEKEANQVVTATVITDCVIKTSSLPARVEVSGNDMYLYEQTTGGGGTVTGDTASIRFVRTDDNTKYYVLQKRAGKDNDLDNVLELFASPPATNAYNYIFIGNDGTGVNPGVNTVSIFANMKSSESSSNPGNGKIQIGLSRNGSNADPNIIIADARATFSNNAVNGITAFIAGSRVGVSGIGHRISSTQIDTGLYQGRYNLVSGSTLANNELFLSHRLLPDADASYDIGGPSNRIKDIYVSGSIIGPTTTGLSGWYFTGSFNADTSFAFIKFANGLATNYQTI